MDKEQIIAEFRRIKNLGFIQSRRKNNTGIGKTFEDYLGVTENNDQLPDFKGFEVKSQRTLTSSFLSLFTKSPSAPRGANTYLRDTYGTVYEDYPDLKVLHTSVFAHKYNTYKNKYGFKIHHDKVNKILRLNIKDLDNEKLIDDSVYWTYQDISKKLETKLKAVFYVTAETKKQSGIEYFHYTKALIFFQPSLERFLELVDNGKLMVDIRIGSYKTGKKRGKTHDHGTGFRIKSQDLTALYLEHFEVE